jgi:hypothetical protein
LRGIGPFRNRSALRLRRLLEEAVSTRSAGTPPSGTEAGIICCEETSSATLPSYHMKENI